MADPATNGVAVTMVWKRLGNVLRRTESTALHECAIVLSLDAALHRRILRARRAFGSALAANQLEPHITLLYCGVRGSDEIVRLEAIAQRFSVREVEFGIMGMGQFSTAAGVITNLHYRLDSTSLHALHAEIVLAYSDAGFAHCTPYVGPRYQPHISLLDRVVVRDADETGVEAGAGAALPSGRYRAGGAHLIGERRDARP